MGVPGGCLWVAVNLVLAIVLRLLKDALTSSALLLVRAQRTVSGLLMRSSPRHLVSFNSGELGLGSSREWRTLFIMPPPLPAVLFPLDESEKYVTQFKEIGPWSLPCPWGRDFRRGLEKVWPGPLMPATHLEIEVLPCLLLTWPSRVTFFF